MLSKKNLESFTNRYQTDIVTISREYCEHLFLSYLYQIPGSERILFKGGTALRIILKSSRFSEDLDFTGVRITQYEVENIFTNTLAEMEKTGIALEVTEGKNTTGGYLGIVTFNVYELPIPIRIEVSLRLTTGLQGIRSVITNDYISSYTLVQLPADEIIQGKLDALRNRHKPRDFYDYWFLLHGDYPLVRKTETLQMVLDLLKNTRIDFRMELRKLLPKSQAMLLRDFRKLLEQKIREFLE